MAKKKKKNMKKRRTEDQKEKMKRSAKRNKNKMKNERKILGKKKKDGRPKTVEKGAHNLFDFWTFFSVVCLHGHQVLWLDQSFVHRFAFFFIRVLLFLIVLYAALGTAGFDLPQEQHIIVIDLLRSIDGEFSDFQSHARAPEGYGFLFWTDFPGVCSSVEAFKRSLTLRGRGWSLDGNGRSLVCHFGRMQVRMGRSARCWYVEVTVSTETQSGRQLSRREYDEQCRTSWSCKRIPFAGV